MLYSLILKFRVSLSLWEMEQIVNGLQKLIRCALELILVSGLQEIQSGKIASDEWRWKKMGLVAGQM